VRMSGVSKDSTGIGTGAQRSVIATKCAEESVLSLLFASSSIQSRSWFGEGDCLVVDWADDGRKLRSLRVWVNHRDIAGRKKLRNRKNINLAYDMFSCT
jgi:hypothetical protein